MELALALPNKQENKFYRAQSTQKQSRAVLLSQQREEYWQIPELTPMRRFPQLHSRKTNVK